MSERPHILPRVELADPLAALHRAADIRAVRYAHDILDIYGHGDGTPIITKVVADRRTFGRAEVVLADDFDAAVIRRSGIQAVPLPMVVMSWATWLRLLRRR